MKRVFTKILVLLVIIIFCSGKSSLAAGLKDMKDLKMLGLFLNYNQPRDSIDEGYDSDFSGGLRLGYGITNNVGAQLSLASFKFDGSKAVGAQDTLTIEALQTDVFYKFDTTTNAYPFVSGGLGYYMIDSGDDDFGINFGIGMMMDLIDLSDMASFDISWNYHRIFSGKSDPSFFEIRAGINFNFF